MEMKSMNTAQDEGSVAVGDGCLAPWQGQLYDGVVITVSGEMTGSKECIRWQLFHIAAGQHNVNSDSDHGDLIKLNHIYHFVTGLDSMPVCGWYPPLTVTFIKQQVEFMGIGACTCSHQLQLPIPLNITDSMPSRKVIFDLFNKSFPDEFFGKA